jgi:hypothetical protein
MLHSGRLLALKLELKMNTCNLRSIKFASKAGAYPSEAPFGHSWRDQICFTVVPGRPFQPSLMFVGEAKSLFPSGRFQPYCQTLNKTGKTFLGQTL